MAGGSIKRHSFSEEDYGFASSMEPRYSRCNNHFHHGFVSRTLRYVRFYDARFEDHQPHFLQACSLCKKPLGDNRDMFMYRWDTPFCSEQHRQE